MLQSSERVFQTQQTALKAFAKFQLSRDVKK